VIDARHTYRESAVANCSHRTSAEFAFLISLLLHASDFPPLFVLTSSRILLSRRILFFFFVNCLEIYVCIRALSTFTSRSPSRNVSCLTRLNQESGLANKQTKHKMK